MEKKILTKKEITIIVAIATVLILVVAGIGWYLIETQEPIPEAEKNVILQVDEKTKEDLEKEKAEKLELSTDKLPEINRKAEQLLSQGKFTDLEAYLRDIESIYRDSSDQTEMIAYERVHGIRQDLAMIAGINTDNGSALLKTFCYPDTLAAAQIYLPLSVKYKSYINLSSVAIPAVKKDQSLLTNLSEQEMTDDEKAELLAAIQEKRPEIVDVAVYRATVAKYSLEIILVHDGETSYWRTYMIRPENGDMTGLISIVQVNRLSDMLIVQNQLTAMDDIITYEEPVVEDPADSWSGRVANTEDDPETAPPPEIPEPVLEEEEEPPVDPIASIEIEDSTAPRQADKTIE